jgi:hypothetical protein
MMDLSKLSDIDLQAVAEGRLQDVSDAGLRIISGQQTPLQRAGTAVDTALGLQPSSPTALLESAKRPAMQVSTSDMDIGRQIGLTGRSAITGALGLPTLASDALVSLINMISGKNIPMPSQAQQALMTQVGIPEPKTAQERTAQDIASAMGGVIGGYGLGAALPASMQASRELLMQSPIFQATSGGAAALASGLAREEGAGPLEQLGYGMLAGTVAPSAGAGAVTAAQAAGRGAREVVRPFTQEGREVIVGNILRQLARDPEMAAARMEQYTPAVPGYTPTAAQASRDVGLAGAVPAVRAMDETGRFTAQQMQANQARVNVLDRLAKDKEALSAAITKRDEVTAPLREAAFAKSTVTPETFGSAIALNVNKTIDDILASPAGKRSTVQSVVTDARDDIARASTPAELYEIRKDLRAAAQGLLDKSDRGGPNASAYKAAKTQLEQIIRSVDETIESAAPGYQDYLRKYAASSRGIERLEAAQEFRAKVKSTIPMMLDDPSRAPEYMLAQPAFVRAIRGIEKETDLSSSQVAVLKRVAKDLDQATFRVTQEPGSNTFKNFSIANIIGGVVGKQMFGEVPAGMQKGVASLNWLYGGSDDAIRAVVVDAMLDPKLAARMMRKATTAEMVPLSKELQQRAIKLGYGQVFGLTPE